jgi:hypothetical protein
LIRAVIFDIDGTLVDSVDLHAEAWQAAFRHSVGVLCGGFPEAERRGAGCVVIDSGPADLLEHYERSPLAG